MKFMKYHARLIQLCLLSALATLCAAAQDARPTPGAAWQKFTAEAGSFNVELPGVPVYRREQQAGRAGETLTSHVYDLHAAGNAYSISYADYPSPDLNIEAFPATFLARFVAEVGQTESGRTDGSRAFSTSFGCAGMEWRGATPDMPFARVKVFGTLRGFYVLFFGATKTNAATTEADAERFFNSFTLAGAPCKGMQTATAATQTVAESTPLNTSAPPGTTAQAPATATPTPLPYGDPKTGATGGGVGSGRASGGDLSDPAALAAALADPSHVFTAKQVTRKAVLLTKPEPGFTEAARRHDLEGEVVLRLVLGADGEVHNIVAVKGLPDGLTEEAVAAAKRIKFEPAQIQGRPVSQYVSVVYNFNIVWGENEVERKAQIVERPAAAYTPEARAQGVTGKVVLLVTLWKTGDVGPVEVVSGLPYGLTEQAAAAARRIKFTPAETAGRPVSQYVTLEYEFKLP
ncbi:MAG TPA: energy transducer TonB [Pyrinomonadaceae bacterium]|jgi:TonB family protein